MLKKIITHPIVAALLAFVIYGCWAYYANHEHGIDKALPAGIAQGAYAFFSTLIVGEMAKRLCLKLGMNIKSIVISFALTFVVMLLIPLIIHSALKTPDIMETILPGLIWGSGYILAILISLYITDKKSKSKTSVDKSVSN